MNLSDLVNEKTNIQELDKIFETLFDIDCMDYVVIALIEAKNQGITYEQIKGGTDWTPIGVPFSAKIAFGWIYHQISSSADLAKAQDDILRKLAPSYVSFERSYSGTHKKNILASDDEFEQANQECIDKIQEIKKSHPDLFAHIICESERFSSLLNNCSREIELLETHYSKSQTRYARLKREVGWNLGQLCDAKSCFDKLFPHENYLEAENVLRCARKINGSQIQKRFPELYAAQHFSIVLNV